MPAELEVEFLQWNGGKAPARVNHPAQQAGAFDQRAIKFLVPLVAYQMKALPNALNPGWDCVR
jgi:hypothetical protein